MVFECLPASFSELGNLGINPKWVTQTRRFIGRACRIFELRAQRNLLVEDRGFDLLGVRVATQSEQGFHLFFGHFVPGGEAERGQSGAVPTPRILAFSGVIIGQTLPAAGRDVIRGDISQVVLEAIACDDFMNRRGHTSIKARNGAQR